MITVHGPGVVVYVSLLLHISSRTFFSPALCLSLYCITPRCVALQMAGYTPTTHGSVLDYRHISRVEEASQDAGG